MPEKAKRNICYSEGATELCSASWTGPVSTLWLFLDLRNSRINRPADKSFLCWISRFIRRGDQHGALRKHSQMMVQ